MKRRFTTVNGSVYEIDDQDKTWTRLQESPASGLLRSGWGPYWEADCHGIGFPLVLTGPPINPEMDKRIVSTSPVVKIEIERDGAWVTTEGADSS